ncbi:MAG TPA: fasciclin domain-containing protein [Mucilaginibacter sp.]|nr:fasciclin domain-containing protein [Mucilaginibacter sp.]
MKKLSLIVFLFFMLSSAMAQQADSAAGKTRIVDGVAMQSSRNMYDNLSRSPEFSTLITAIDSAGLKNALSTGSITFLAPSNKAFEKLQPGYLDTLLKPAHRTELINLLNNHIITGRFTSKDLARLIKENNGQTVFTTAADGKLTASINENRNIVLTDENDGQSVISRFDIEESNGILDIVTTVLVPGIK